MLTPSRPRPTHGRDPTEWEYHVRSNDRTWLARPERVEGEAAGNAPAFSPIIPDSWAFDDPSSARRAALSHGATEGTFVVVPAPRDPAAWLARSSSAGMAKLAAEMRAQEQEPDTSS